MTQENRIYWTTIGTVIFGVVVPCVVAFLGYFSLAWLWALNHSESGSTAHYFLAWKRATLFELSVLSVWLIYIMMEGICWIIVSYMGLVRRHSHDSITID